VQLRTSFVALVLFIVLTDLIYPLAITGVAQITFPTQANGSLIKCDGRAIRSELIGQTFDGPKYFWGRPSATGPFPYNAALSSGSNLAVGNPAQLDAIKARVEKLRASGIPADQPIPVDRVTASGSGLDPHISPAAARIQVPRVARSRNLNQYAVLDENAGGRQCGILGEPHVTIIKLNLALDAGAKL
jgi:K+-transporting ATPase ATPase C chain